MILFYCPEGPMISYEREGYGEVFEETFIVDDLNPENHIRFRMTPWELFKFGFWCISAAVFP